MAKVALSIMVFINIILLLQHNGAKRVWVIILLGTCGDKTCFGVETCVNYGLECGPCGKMIKLLQITIKKQSNIANIIEEIQCEANCNGNVIMVYAIVTPLGLVLHANMVYSLSFHPCFLISTFLESCPANNA